MHEIMAGYWPTADQDPAAPSVLIRGDAVAEAARRKAQPGGGSIGVAGLLLASALASAGLIDGWHLYYVPIFPGSGKAAFSQIQNRRQTQAGRGPRIPFRAGAPEMRSLEAPLLMWGLCRSAPTALRVSFASKSNRAVLALRVYNLKGEP